MRNFMCFCAHGYIAYDSERHIEWLTTVSKNVKNEPSKLLAASSNFYRVSGKGDTLYSYNFRFKEETNQTTKKVFVHSFYFLFANTAAKYKHLKLLPRLLNNIT